MCKLLIILVVGMLLFVKINTGHLPAGTWSKSALACIAKCCVLGPGTPAYKACFLACWFATGPGLSLFCFSENTTVITPNGKINISDAVVNQKVLTLNQKGIQTWTTLKLVAFSKGRQFILIRTQNKSLQVTLNHLMIINNNKLVKAKQLSIGMRLGNQTIKQLILIQKETQITIMTTSGTILVNGILTTTVCQEYIDIHGNNLEVLEQWKQDHQWLM